MALPEPKVWRDAEVIYAPVWREHDGTTPIQNSAEAPYPKQVIEPVSVGVIHCIAYKAYTDAHYKNQLNATNAAAWRGWEPGQAWVSRIITNDDLSVGGATNVSEVHYIVRCLETGWDALFADIGYVYIDASSYKPFLADGQPYLGKLDGAGGQQAVASDLVINEHQIKRRINFASELGF